MTGAELFLWAIYPYIVLTLFLAVSLYRYQTNPYGWTSKSSEVLEKRILKWGSPLFHWGIVFVFFGHVGGLLVPIAVYRALGVSDEVYHALAAGVGSLAGLAALAGLLLLLYRRLKVRRIRVTSSVGDFAALAFLLIVIATGISATAQHAAASDGFDYRTSINPWIRGVLAFQPDPSLMAGVPGYFKLHVVAAFGLFAAFPFTRLVHVFSLPIAYLWRSYVLYRKRGRPAPRHH